MILFQIPYIFLTITLYHSCQIHFNTLIIFITGRWWERMRKVKRSYKVRGTITPLLYKYWTWQFVVNYILIVCVILYIINSLFAFNFGQITKNTFLVLFFRNSKMVKMNHVTFHSFWDQEI